MATTVSCIIVTTLILVSLANLVLLVHVIIHTISKCEQMPVKKTQKIRKRAEDAVFRDHKTTIDNYKFMTAVVILSNEIEVEFACGGAVIGKNWVLTTAHCIDSLKNQPMYKVKITSNSSKYKYGILHDVDKIIVHENYNPFTRKNDVALMKVRQQFKGKNVESVALAEAKFKYMANSTATNLEWSETDLVAIEVKLVWYKHCEDSYPNDSISDSAMFCAGTKKCVFSNYEGILVQKNVLIGMTAFGVGCGAKPAVYTRISMFARWIKSLEKSDKIETVFKIKI